MQHAFTIKAIRTYDNTHLWRSVGRDEEGMSEGGMSEEMFGVIF